MRLQNSTPRHRPTAAFCTRPSNPSWLLAKSYTPHKLSGLFTVITPAVSTVNHVSFLTPPRSPLPLIRVQRSLSAAVPGEGRLAPRAFGSAMSCLIAGESLTEAADAGMMWLLLLLWLL